MRVRHATSCQWGSVDIEVGCSSGSIGQRKMRLVICRNWRLRRLRPLDQLYSMFAERCNQKKRVVESRVHADHMTGTGGDVAKSILNSVVDWYR